MGREVDTPRSGVRGMGQRAVGKLWLDVEVPLLSIGVWTTGNNSADPFPKQSLLKTRVAARRLNNAGWEGVAQTVERCEPTVEGCHPGRTDSIDNIVVRGIIPLHIAWEPEQPVSAPDDRFVAQPISETEAGVKHLLAHVNGVTTFPIGRVDQSQPSAPRQTRWHRQGIYVSGEKDIDTIEVLRPKPMEGVAYTQLQSTLLC